MSRIISRILMGLALAGMVLVGADTAMARGGGGGGRGGGGGGSRSFSSGGGRSFSSSARSFSAPSTNRSFSSGGNWNGNRNWSGNWNGNRNWNGNWGGRGNWRWNGNSWVWAVAPLIGLGLGDGYWGYGYPYYGYGYGYGYPYYNNYGYGYNYPYSYDNGYSTYDYSQPYSYGYSQPYSYSQPAYGSSTQANPPDSLSQAISVFQSGNFREAERLAHHLVIDEPNNARAHLVLCLTAFANGDFRTASDEAGEAINLGETPNWSQVYAIYGNVDRYTSNLRALENAVKQNPRDGDAQFLLGFMYLANGYRSDAQEHLAMAHDAMPNDRVVSNLLSEAGGQVPTTAARPNEPQRFESPNAPMNVQPGNRPENVGPSNNAPMNVQPGDTGSSTGPTSGQNSNQPPAPPTEIRSSAPNNSSGPPAGGPPMAPTETSNGNRAY